VPDAVHRAHHLDPALAVPVRVVLVQVRVGHVDEAQVDGGGVGREDSRVDPAVGRDVDAQRRDVAAPGRRPDQGPDDRTGCRVARRPLWFCSS
jgi:hypothetical protein